jgi:Yip1 domain
MSILHTFGILTHPDREWQTIREEHESTPKLFLTHIILLAIIPAAAAFYGTTQVGWRVGDGELIRLSQGSAAQLCILFYAAMLSGIFIIGKFIDFFAATYGVDEKEHNGIILAAYTATPLFLIGVIAVYPVLWVNMLAGVVAVGWSVYLLYEGLPILMKIPEGRGFMFATSILTVGLCMLVGLFAISVIVWSIGIGPEFVS